jgi:hypothetical protein
VKARARTAFKYGFSLFLTVFIASCAKPKTTDIDHILKAYVEQREGFQFQPNCKKPKEFRGIDKFKVDCLISVSDEAWGNSFGGSHSDFFHKLRSSGYKHIGATSIPGAFIKPKSSDLEIQIFSKPTATDKCDRIIYIDIRELHSGDFESPKGTRIVIADPWVLSCSE